MVRQGVTRGSSRHSVLRVAGPTLDDVTNAVCPESQLYKCLPYGGCYSYDSYCDPNSQSVESCFPHNLETNESKLAFCHDVQQNVSKLLHPTCRYACLTLFPERPGSLAVCESCSDVSIWLYAAVVVIIAQLCVIVWLCTPCKSYKKKIYKRVTFKCQDARADGYAPAAVTEEAEKPEMLVEIRMSDDQNVPPDTDVDVSEATQLQSQIQNRHQQQNQTQQPLENTNGSPQLQQPSLTNSVDEVPQSYPSSGNDSAMSSPASLSPSASSVSTDDDSGVSSERDGRIDHISLVQQVFQPQVLINQNGGFNQQANDERRPNINFYTNASIPDQESKVVTSLSQYRD